MSVTTGAVVMLVLVFGPARLLLVPLVAAVGWARVVLNDHSPAQSVAGATLGGLVAFGVFSALR